MAFKVRGQYLRAVIRTITTYEPLEAPSTQSVQRSARSFGRKTETFILSLLYKKLYFWCIKKTLIKKELLNLRKKKISRAFGRHAFRFLCRIRFSLSSTGVSSPCVSEWRRFVVENYCKVTSLPSRYIIHNSCYINY